MKEQHKELIRSPEMRLTASAMHDDKRTQSLDVGCKPVSPEDRSRGELLWMN